MTVGDLFYHKVVLELFDHGQKSISYISLQLKGFRRIKDEKKSGVKRRRV